jgi:cytoskeleton protein RodZ
MTSVEFGAAMRDMRKEHNRELSDVANALRIRQVYLQALEDGRFDDLPGSTYAAGFVRAYADYLGLELDEVMRRYRSAVGNIPAQAALAPPSPMSEARLPTGFILLVAAILAAAAYGGWYYLTIYGQSPAEIVSALPKRISDAVGLGDKSATKSVPPEVMKSSATASGAAIRPNPIAAPVVTASTNIAVAVVEKMPTAESGQPQPVISAPLATAKLPKTVTVQAPPENLESRIVLRASVTSWVELRDVGGRRLLSRLLVTGETYKVPGRSGILFTTGNAGGIDIFVDGQPIAALGPVGAVRRDIAMEPKTLLTRKLGQR